MEDNPFGKIKYDKYYYSLYHKDPWPKKGEHLLDKLQGEVTDDVPLVHRVQAMQLYTNKATLRATTSNEV